MRLHERHANLLGTNILTILSDEEKFVENTLRREMLKKKLESGVNKVDKMVF